MTLVAVVLTAIGALIVGLVVGIFISRRARTVAPLPSPDGPAVADLVERVVLSSHNGVVLL